LRGVLGLLLQVRAVVAELSFVSEKKPPSASEDGAIPSV
jgi:hypothetical protein